MPRRALAAVALGLVACGPGAAQTAPGLVEAFAERTAFNGVVLVADGGDATVWTFGHEDLEAGVATCASTRYQLGSISKWVSTLVVFRLADEGGLDLDAPLSTYLPDYRSDSGSRVTLHHLVTHTSGVPNGLIAAFQADPTLLDEGLSQSQAVARSASGDLLFPPGERFDYSHSDWILVQAILERTTGRTYEALVREHLADPLGLTGTEVMTGSAFASDHLAVGYTSLAPPERADARFQGYLAATGGVVSTAGDLLTVLDALYTLLSDALRARLDAVVSAGENYASGGRVRTLDLGRGAETVAWHAGSNGPSTSRVSRAVASGLTVITLSNTGADSDDTGALAEGLLETLAR